MPLSRLDSQQRQQVLCAKREQRRRMKSVLQFLTMKFSMYGFCLLVAIVSCVLAHKEDEPENCSVVGVGSDTRVMIVKGRGSVPTGWADVDFDDSDFSDSRFPLSGGTPCYQFKDTEVGGVFPLNSVMLTRTSFEVHDSKAEGIIQIHTNGSADVFINGKFLLTLGMKGCEKIGLGKSVYVPKEYFEKGRNVVAVLAGNRGNLSVLQVEMKVGKGKDCDIHKPKKGCDDVASKSDCKFWADLDMCSFSLVKAQCRKTCGRCPK